MRKRVTIVASKFRILFKFPRPLTTASACRSSSRILVDNREMVAVELPPLPEAQKTYAGIPEAVFLVIIKWKWE